MTTLLKNASYIKVSHAGQTSGPLFLADLADEENAKEEKKIPVYVPEGGSITLPLDEDVLLSYQQGTIRGLEDQGFLTTELLDNRGAAEIWVSPNGDDSNPGTRNAPYASIQKAVDDLAEEYGKEAEKRVYLDFSGTSFFSNWEIDSPVILGPKNSHTRIIGTGKNISRFTGVSTSSGPAFIVSDLDDVGSFVSSGGVGYSVNTTTGAFTLSGEDGHTYSGEGAFSTYDISIEDLKLVAPVWLVGSTLDAVLRFQLRNCFIDVGSGNNALYMLGGGENKIYGLASDGEVVLDRCKSIHWAGVDVHEGDAFVDTVIVNESEGDPFGYVDGNALFKNIYVDGNQDNEIVGSYQSQQFNVENGVIGGDGIVGKSDAFVRIKAQRLQGLLKFTETSQLHAIDSVFYDLQKTSSGAMVVKKSHIQRNVTIEAGSNTTLKNCVIEGDLQVDSPASATLENVTVLGNLEGDGDIDFTGGGWAGSNNNTGTVTHTDLNTTP